MIEKFRICIIVPNGYQHSQCFMEVAFLLKYSLNSLGIQCDLSVNDFSRDRINIILGWHLLAGINNPESYKYIPYQLEQLSDSTWKTFSAESKTILEHAFYVWDYSAENISFLSTQGIHADYLPIGYHKGLELINSDIDKDIDVLFFGSLGERRKHIIDSLTTNNKLKVQTLFGIYGKKRDEYIGRSRIILNVHFYPSKIFEAVRISYLLNNRCCVVSEESPLYPYNGVDIPMYKYENIVEECRILLNNKEKIERLRNSSYLEFRQKYPMTQFLKHSLQQSGLSVN
jgi:hypothetical protein